MGGDDHVVRGQARAGRLDGQALVLAHLDRARALVDRAARGDELVREREQVAPRVELRLVVEAERSRHGVGQRRVVDHRGAQPGRAGGLRLRLELLARARDEA